MEEQDIPYKTVMGWVSVELQYPLAFLNKNTFTVPQWEAKTSLQAFPLQKHQQ